MAKGLEVRKTRARIRYGYIVYTVFADGKHYRRILRYRPIGRIKGREARVDN